MQSTRPDHNRKEVERFIARIEALRFDDAAAGHARGRGLIVVTGNLDEFPRFEGLRREDWLA